MQTVNPWSGSGRATRRVTAQDLSALLAERLGEDHGQATHQLSSAPRRLRDEDRFIGKTPAPQLAETEAANDQPHPTASKVILARPPRLGTQARTQQENTSAAFERGLASGRRTGLVGGFAFGISTGALLSFMLYVILQGAKL